MFNVYTHNGEITMLSTKTGEHRTIRIRTMPNDSSFAPGARIAELLVGPDNTSDYRSFAFVNSDSVVVFRKHLGTMFEKLVPLISTPEKYVEKGLIEYSFSGRCRKCNRLLTTPDSIANGIGPVCASK
jgi:hypothetical protein